MPQQGKGPAGEPRERGDSAGGHHVGPLPSRTDTAAPRPVLARPHRQAQILHDLTQPVDATRERFDQYHRRSGRARANGIPGSPAPDPRSTTRAPSGTNSATTAQLRMWRSHIRGASRGPISPRSTPVLARWPAIAPGEHQPVAERRAPAAVHVKRAVFHVLHRPRHVPRETRRAPASGRCSRTLDRLFSGRVRHCGRRRPAAAAPRPRSRCRRPRSPATASCTTLRSNGVIGAQPHRLAACRAPRCAVRVPSSVSSSRAGRRQPAMSSISRLRLPGDCCDGQPGQLLQRLQHRAAVADQLVEVFAAVDARRSPGRPRRPGRCRRRSPACPAGAPGSRPRRRPRGPTGPRLRPTGRRRSPPLRLRQPRPRSSSSLGVTDWRHSPSPAAAAVDWGRRWSVGSAPLPGGGAGGRVGAPAAGRLVRTVRPRRSLRLRCDPAPFDPVPCTSVRSPRRSWSWLGLSGGPAVGRRGTSVDRLADRGLLGRLATVSGRIGFWPGGGRAWRSAMAWSFFSASSASIFL